MLRIQGFTNYRLQADLLHLLQSVGNAPEVQCRALYPLCCTSRASPTGCFVPKAHRFALLCFAPSEGAFLSNPCKPEGFERGCAFLQSGALYATHGMRLAKRSFAWNAPEAQSKAFLSNPCKPEGFERGCAFLQSGALYATHGAILAKLRFAWRIPCKALRIIALYQLCIAKGMCLAYKASTNQ